MTSFRNKVGTICGAPFRVPLAMAVRSRGLLLFLCGLENVRKEFKKQYDPAIADLKEQLQAFREDRQKRREAATRQDAKIAELSGRLQVVTADRDQCRETAGQQETRILEQKTRIVEQETRIVELNEQLRLLQAECEQHRERIEKQKEEMKAQNEQFLAYKETARQNTAALKNEVSEWKQTREKLQSAAKNKDEKIEQLRVSLKYARNESRARHAEARRKFFHSLTARENHGNPAISFVLPIYNTPESFLRECLDSIRAQTFGDFEVICVDNGSQDPRCAEIVREYIGMDSRFRLVSLSENQLVGGGRNAGLRQAKGKYILFVDTDDTVSPDLCKCAYFDAEMSQSDVTVFDFLDIKGENEVAALGGYPLRDLSTTDGKSILVFRTLVWNKIWNRRFLLENNIFFPENVHGEDVYFCWLASIHAEKVSRLDETLYRRRHHLESASYTDERFHFGLFSILQQIHEQITVRKPQDEWMRLFLKNKLTLLYRHVKSIRETAPQLVVQVEKETLQTLEFDSLQMIQGTEPLDKGVREFFAELIDRWKQDEPELVASVFEKKDSSLTVRDDHDFFMQKMKIEYPFQAENQVVRRYDMTPKLPHVTITGYPCSGTTIMGKVLGQHPSVLNICDPDNPLPPHLRMRRNPVESFIFEPSSKNTDRKILRMLREIEEIAHTNGKIAVLEKTPSHIWATDRINAVIPKVKFVCMVRDGRDNVVSMMKGFGKSLEISLETYINTMERIMECQAKLKNMIVVRLEDFTANPEEKVAEILEFLQLESSPKIINYMINPIDSESTSEQLTCRSSMVTADGQRTTVTAIRLEQRRQPIAKDTSRWHELSREEQDAILPKIRPYLEHFGYLGREGAETEDVFKVA